MISYDPTTREGLIAILGIAREAAREASLVALPGYRRALTVEHKGEVDLVTRFDRETEDLLRKRLGAALPFAFVGEERGGAPGSKDDVALYVDPIDGTTNFVHGHPFWCVSIGLAIRGEPVLGVVLSPPLGIEWFGWTAASGERFACRRAAQNALLAPSTSLPAIVEDTCRVSTTAAFDQAFLATGFPADRRTSSDNNFDAFVHIKRRCQGIRRCGSAAIDLCLVADGTYDGYWERKLHAWDIAGGSAIVRAAGGRVTDFTGGADYVANGRVIATNGAIHERLMAELAQVEGPRTS